MLVLILVWRAGDVDSQNTETGVSDLENMKKVVE